MTPEFAYLLKVNVAFVLFYAFYRLFFYKDTFLRRRRKRMPRRPWIGMDGCWDLWGLFIGGS